jgi:hypothetical protein
MGLLRRAFGGNWPGQQLERVTIIDPPEPLEGTRMSLWNSILPNWYAEQDGSTLMGTPDLVQRVWVASRCQHLNASQIAAMPLKWHGSAGVLEPRWVSSPDPQLFPNGIGDALYAITDQLYGWGYSLQVVTSRYQDGFPRTWTVIPSSACVPAFDDNGRRKYDLGGTLLDPADVIQVDRNPTTAAHGTSAISAYAQRAYSLLAAGNKSLSVSQDAFPSGYLKAEQRLTADQAASASTQWMAKAGVRNGAPPVLGQGWDFKASGIDPADMALLDTQQWDAMVLATAYGVPGPVLNMALTGGLTYQNPLALTQGWWLTELRTTAKRIVDAFTAQALPSGQWVSVDASDITLELNEQSDDDDPQSAVVKASPAQQPGRLTAVGGVNP